MDYPNDRTSLIVHKFVLVAILTLYSSSFRVKKVFIHGILSKYLMVVFINNIMVGSMDK